MGCRPVRPVVGRLPEGVPTPRDPLTSQVSEDFSTEKGCTLACVQEPQGSCCDSRASLFLPTTLRFPSTKHNNTSESKCRLLFYSPIVSYLDLYVERYNLTRGLEDDSLLSFYQYYHKRFPTSPMESHHSSPHPSSVDLSFTYYLPVF